MVPPPLALLDHLTQQTFAFALRGWKEPAAAFFAPSAENTDLLKERRHWLADDPDRYILFTPGAADLIGETLSLACQLSPAFSPSAASPAEGLRRLGEFWEADFILCRKNTAGQICMEGGVVCFPSHWAPETKLGLPIEALHAPVPGLNTALGGPIFNLLDRLPAGYAWQRINWGLSASPERNQHPCRNLPRLNAGTPLEAIWLRLEHQALVRLPISGGILFGIRLHSFNLPALCTNPPAARAVAGQLQSMPHEMQVYKGIAEVAARVAEWLWRSVSDPSSS